MILATVGYMGSPSSQFKNAYFTEMSSGSEEGNSRLERNKEENKKTGHAPSHYVKDRMLNETIASYRGTSTIKNIQGYLAHKKLPPPSRNTIGRLAYSYCRVLGGDCFLSARYPCKTSVHTSGRVIHRVFTPDTPLSSCPKSSVHSYGHVLNQVCTQPIVSRHECAYLPSRPETSVPTSVNLASQVLT